MQQNGVKICTENIAHSTLQGTLLKTLVEAKPTLFFGVPRVYEKIQEKMMEVSR